MSRSVVCENFNNAELKFCYPDKRGLVFPDFSDSATLRELNHALPNYLGLKANGGSFKMMCPDGQKHKFGLFIDDNGRYLIRDFQNDNYLFGRYADYSCDIIGLELAQRGLPQTEDNVFSLVGAKDGKKRDVVLPIKRNVQVEKEDITKNALKLKEDVKVWNAQVWEKALDEKTVQFVEKDGDDKVVIPTLLKDVLEKRGLNYNKIPYEYLERLGFSTGIKLYSQSGKLIVSPLRGVIFKLDNLGTLEGGMQWRLMQEKKNGEKLSYEYITKEDEETNQYLHRYFNYGTASTFAQDIALKQCERPIIITEGIFDALSIVSVANGKVSAVALQGCGNHKYFINNAEKLKITNTPIILALDEDQAGKNGKRKLESELSEKGCKVLSWPGCLGAKDINDLLKEDVVTAKNLVNVVATIATLMSKNLLTPSITRGVLKAVTGGKLNAWVKEGSQVEYGNLIMKVFEKEGKEARSNISSFNKELAQYLCKNKSIQDAFSQQVKNKQYSLTKS